MIAFFSRLTLLAILFLCANAYAQNGDDTSKKPLLLDIEKAIEIALDQNPDVKIARDNEDVANAEIRAIKSLALPHLSLRSSYSRNLKKPAFFARFGEQLQKIEIGSNNAFSTAINFDQRIYETGQFGMGKAIEITKLLSRVSRENSVFTRLNIVFEVRRAFYTVLLSKDVVTVFEETLSQAQAHYENLQKQFAEGVASEFDLLRSEVQVAEVQPQLIKAQNNLEISQNILKNTMGLPLDRPIRLEGAMDLAIKPETDMQQSLQQGMRRRSELRQLDLNERIALLNVSIQKGGWLPSVSLNASYQFQGQSNDFQFSPLERNASLAATLNVRFNIFDGFETSAKIQKAQAELSRLQNRKEQAARAIEIEIRQAVQNIKEAQERILAQQKSVQQAQKAHRIAELRYEQGVGTQLELFDARLALNRIKLNHLQAVYDYNIAVFAWEKATGLINQ